MTWPEDANLTQTDESLSTAGWWVRGSWARGMQPVTTKAVMQCDRRWLPDSEGTNRSSVLAHKVSRMRSQNRTILETRKLKNKQTKHPEHTAGPRAVRKHSALALPGLGAAVRPPGRRGLSTHLRDEASAPERNNPNLLMSRKPAEPSFLMHRKSSPREKAVTLPCTRLVSACAQCASAGQWTVEGKAAPGGDSRLAWGAAQTCSGVHGAMGGAGVLVGAVHTQLMRGQTHTSGGQRLRGKCWRGQRPGHISNGEHGLAKSLT